MTPWKRFCQDWKGKKVLIMGLGLQGRGVGDAKVFAEAGARVTVTDLKTETKLAQSLEKLQGLNIRYVLGKHQEEDFSSSDVIIRNPDVPINSSFLEIAKKAGIPVKMDSSLFAKYCPFPIIGITGTRGKTTTTMMIYEVLKNLYPGPVFLGGNVPGNATLELLCEVSSREAGSCSAGQTSPASIVILELSSWELQGWHDEKISPHIGVFTNFYQDHLNRYASMDEYFQDKLAILRHQKKTDWAILNADNPWIKKAATETNARIKWFSAKDLPQEVSLHIPGEHNRANAAAALAAVSAIGVEGKEGLEVLEGFRGVPFRLETIAMIDGIEYINDTTSTTPASGIAGLRAMTKPVVLIAGGSSKKLDLEPFTEEILKKVKHIVFLKGKGTDEILSDIASLDPSTRRRLLAQDDMQVFNDFRQAVERARTLAQPGDVVLLSPGCASFSMFKNEFDRGEKFNQIIRKWQKK